MSLSVASPGKPSGGVVLCTLAIFVLVPTLWAKTVLFLPTLTIDSGAICSNSIAAADVNGDGIVDLVVAGGCEDVEDEALNGTVSVLLGNGDGTFKPAVNYYSGGVSTAAVSIADVNGDGKPDLLVASPCSTAICPTGAVAVLLGNGDGTFQPAVSYDAGSPYALAVADVNGDGKPDIVVNAGNSVGVLLGNGDGTFQPMVTYYGGAEIVNSVAIADVNHDGKPDVLAANECTDSFCTVGSVGVLLGNGNGTFQAPVTYDSGGQGAIDIAVADVNGDGNPDVLVTNGCVSDDACPTGSVGVLLGNGDGTFQPALSFESGAHDPNSLAVGDLNGDGKPDVAVSHCTALGGNGCPTYGGAVGVLLGNGDGTFQKAVDFPSGGIAANSVAITDVNGDGLPDLVLANRLGESDGDGTVGVIWHNSISFKPTSVALSSSANPAFLGQPVTLTATVTSADGVVPNGGVVTFFGRATAVGSGLTTNGIATLTTTLLPLKVKTVSATYSGTPSFAPSTKTIDQVVDKWITTTTVVSQPNPSAYGQAVSFTATVTSGGPSVPAGKVRFTDGTTGLKTVTLVSGVATFTDSELAAGSHSIKVEYDGDSSSAISTSPVLTQVVQ